MTEYAMARRAKLPWLLGGRPLRPDRGGYTVTMREDEGTAAALDGLRMSRCPRSGIHLGWGSFRNLDIAAARGSSRVFLCDINLHQFRIWRAVRPAVIAATSPAAFVDAVAPTLPQHPRLRMFSTDVREWIGQELSRRESWLHEGSPERYRHVRSLFCARAVHVLQLDFATAVDAPHRPFQRLTAQLANLNEHEGHTLDTVYISNIPFMLQQPVGFFGEDQSAKGRDADSTQQAVRHNLGLLRAPGVLLITAEQLASTSRDNDLQWRTRVMSLDQYLEPGSG
ncbi:MAG: hypothetical protein Q7J47_20250 [Azoarcus sp.]|nr:hypothetical protein [Azoarcus sp.]